MLLFLSLLRVCNSAIELPQKIAEVSRKLPNNEVLLSVEDLQKQLLEVRNKQKSSSGVSKQYLQQLATSLQRNIELAKAGKDTRQAKIFSLHQMVQDSAGLLQQLENKLRTVNLNNSEEIQELRNLSDELNSYQDNIKMFL